MPKRVSKDVATIAYQRMRSVIAETEQPKVVEISTGQAPRPKEKNPAAVALGLLGGKKGGEKRAENLSPERRKEIAQRAANTRWARRKEDLQ